MMTEPNPSSKEEIMPLATPGVGECNICMEVVPYVKVLDCDHTICVPCAQKMVHGAGTVSIECPTCRMATDVQRGLDDLPNRYFGKIKCDLCLDKKTTDDMWWCQQCVRALCSKCSIKEHGATNHSISEWNRMEAVRCCVDYINRVEYKHQQCCVSDQNKQLIKNYLHQVERCLLKQLVRPSEICDIRENLLSRYGTRFSTDSSNGDHSHQSDEIEAKGPKLVAKVLQLAGANIVETLVPKINEKLFQVHITMNPEDLAHELHKRIEFIPIELEYSKSPCTEQVQLKPVPTVDETKSESSDSAHELKIMTRITSNMPVLGLDVSTSTSTVALRMNADVQLYNVERSESHSIPVSKRALSVRSVRMSGNFMLLALQSTTKVYEWSIECHNVQEMPPSLQYTAICDIDPEDDVDDLQLSMPETFAPFGHIFELRVCKSNVSEIWRASPKDKKKGRVKLKEQLVYQRGDSRIRFLEYHEVSAKERYLFVWDDVSSCVQRLIINKEGRCVTSTNIVHSVDPVPFCLYDNRLYMFDPHTQSIMRTPQPCTNRLPIQLRQIIKYTAHPLRSIHIIESGLKIVCAAVNQTDVQLVYFDSA